MIRKEVGLFAVIGSLTVCVDLLFYQLFLLSGIGYVLAKGTGFICGTIFAYFANRYWTFSHVTQRSSSLPRFAMLYGATLLVNVLINQAALQFLGHTGAIVGLAFLAATAISALLNFMGMKYFVFKGL